jgi:hypothetical protein
VVNVRQKHASYLAEVLERYTIYVIYVYCIVVTKLFVPHVATHDLLTGSKEYVSELMARAHRHSMSTRSKFYIKIFSIFLAMWAKKKQQLELGLQSLLPNGNLVPTISSAGIKLDQRDEVYLNPRGPKRRIPWTDGDSQQLGTALQIFGKGQWTKIEDYLMTSGKMESPRKSSQLKDRSGYC